MWEHVNQEITGAVANRNLLHLSLLLSLLIATAETDRGHQVTGEHKIFLIHQLLLLLLNLMGHSCVPLALPTQVV